MQVKIYHNPRCSKSRQTLDLLHQRGIEPEVIRYLDTPLNESDIKALLARLDMQAKDLLRSKEPEARELGLTDANTDDDQIISAMASHPKLMERPVVVVDDSRAVIGRPPERVFELLDADPSS